MAEQDPSRTLIVGLSGPSSSGKTTLARLLRSIFNVAPEEGTNLPAINLFILHQDDFYKTDKLIPRKTFTSPEHGTRELEDWDCVESLDLDLLEHTLKHVKTHGVLPPDAVSKEDQNEIGESGVDDATVKQLQDNVRHWLLQSAASSKPEQQSWTICIMDGFLLYPRPPLPPAPAEQQQTLSSSSSSSESARLCVRLTEILAPLLSLRLFIPSSRALTIARRARRTGYVTLEGFWADPPGYVEDVVWPNYSADHAWMFNAANREGEGCVDMDLDEATQRNVDEGHVNWAVATGSGIEQGPNSANTHMTEILTWGESKVRNMLEEAMR